MKSIAPLERGKVPIMAAVLAAALAALLAAGPAIPVARAGQPDLVGALRARGAQIVPLGVRGGLSGYLVTPPKGAGYSLYVTDDGHGVAGLLYRPDGVLLTGRQLAAARFAAVRDRNRPAGTAPNPPGTRAPGTTSVAPADPEEGPEERREVRPKERPEEPPQWRCASAVAPPAGESRAQAGGAGARESAGPARTATRQPAKGVSRAARLEGAASAFGFTLGRRGPLVVVFGDARCPWSRSAVARIGREAMAGKLRLRVVPVALLGAVSAQRAARIAASPDPAQAWFARTDGPPGGPPAGPAARDRIARNNAAFESWGARAVPLIVYRSVRGGIVHRVGDVADLGVWLRDLGDE